MSISTKGSFDYKYVDVPSINHPSIDRNLNDSFSSYESVENPHIPSSGSSIKLSIKSEPLLRKALLTEKELARHNSMYEQTFCNTEEEERGEGKRLLDRVDERCELLKKEFESRMKRLEEQLTKTEQEFSQSRCDIEELHSMEKEYINQGIQTDLRCEDIEKIQEVAETMNSTSPNEIKEWKENYGNMEQFTNQAKRLIWDTPFIPVHSICRQLPTHVNEEDVCDYHRQRIEVLKLKSEKEKSLYQKDNQATLDKISHWAGAIKRSSLL